MRNGRHLQSWFEKATFLQDLMHTSLLTQSSRMWTKLLLFNQVHCLVLKQILNSSICPMILLVSQPEGSFFCWAIRLLKVLSSFELI